MLSVGQPLPHHGKETDERGIGRCLPDNMRPEQLDRPSPALVNRQRYADAAACETIARRSVQVPRLDEERTSQLQRRGVTGDPTGLCIFSDSLLRNLSVWLRGGRGW